MFGAQDPWTCQSRKLMLTGQLKEMIRYLEKQTNKTATTTRERKEGTKERKEGRERGWGRRKWGCCNKSVNNEENRLNEMHKVIYQRKQNSEEETKGKSTRSYKSSRLLKVIYQMFMGLPLIWKTQTLFRCFLQRAVFNVYVRKSTAFKMHSVLKNNKTPRNSNENI